MGISLHPFSVVPCSLFPVPFSVVPCSLFPVSLTIGKKIRFVSTNGKTFALATECDMRAFCHFVNRVSKKSCNAILRDSLLP